MAEERVDEVGLALDDPAPAADQGLKLVEGGSGVVSQAAFHDGPAPSTALRSGA